MYSYYKQCSSIEDFELGLTGFKDVNTTLMTSCKETFFFCIKTYGSVQFSVFYDFGEKLGSWHVWVGKQGIIFSIGTKNALTKLGIPFTLSG